MRNFKKARGASASRCLRNSTCRNRITGELPYLGLFRNRFKRDID